MSRKKKSRKLGDRITVKTGSKKNFLAPGQKGRMPSKNKLAKHRNRPKSAYQKYLEENNLTEEQYSSQTQSEKKKQESPPAKPPSSSTASERVDTAQDTPAADFDELDGEALWDRFDSGSDR